ncbi:MAG: polynucleotide kinase-phosphatase, partial [Stackebrandtia sp.]
LDVADLAARTDARLANVRRFSRAYARYCWPTEGLDGVRLAPFQLLAAGTENLARRGHDWQLETLDALVAADDSKTLRHTGRVFVDLSDDATAKAGRRSDFSRAAAVRWWTDFTADGGEGMVVKPVESPLRGKRGLVQPGLKVRGREYLRIIYGPDYTEESNLEKLRARSLGRKRSLALREYALGMEALDRLVSGAPLWRVHETVFSVLALESEPVDPRL